MMPDKLAFSRWSDERKSGTAREGSCISIIFGIECFSPVVNAFQASLLRNDGGEVRRGMSVFLERVSCKGDAPRSRSKLGTRR